MTGTEVFKRTAVYDREVGNIRLHAPQWKLLLAFDGQRTVSETALNAGIPFPEASPMVENFLKEEWIAEQPITLEEYLRRASAGGNYSGGVIPSSVIVKEPVAETKQEKVSVPEAPALKPAPGGTPAPVSVSTPPAAAPPTASAVETTALPKEPVRSPARGPMRLSSVVDYIISIAETIPLGQLLAYRVFLRVPPEVLQSEDIVSIHLVDDTSLVRSEGLQKAIQAAVQEIIKRPLPESVYASA